MLGISPIPYKIKLPHILANLKKLDTSFALGCLEVARGIAQQLAQRQGYKTKSCTQQKEDMLLIS